jgi:argininosuccinate synthase
LLIGLHRELEKLVLSAGQQQWKDTLGNVYGNLLHESRVFDPLARDIEAFLSSSQEVVTGEVRATLYPRGFSVEGVRSPYSLMDAGVANYGETNQLWDGAEARAFAKLYGVSQRLAVNARQRARQKTGDAA